MLVREVLEEFDDVMRNVKELDRVGNECYGDRIPQEYPIVIDEVVSENLGPVLPVVLAIGIDEAKYESLPG